MKIVIAMDSFKNTTPATEACEIVARVIAKFIPAVKLSIKPMADGGEGTAEAMLKSASGQWVLVTVTGPLPDMQVQAGFAWFEHTHTALVEMASASGLQLLSPDQYNPMKTTTYGTGQLIKAALEYKPSKILLAVGGSATVDGGIGAATALGWKFLDQERNQVTHSGQGLIQIAKIIKPPEPISPTVEVLCDVTNPLCGDEGAAKIYAPQKGATPEMVDKLEKGLEHLAELAKNQLSKDIDVPGAGAAGGWIITGEGCFDRQSLYGKVVAGVAETAAKSNTPIAVIAGHIDLTKDEYQKIGIRTAIACKPKDMSLDEALKNSRALLRSAAEKFVKQNLT
jgi:glycerate kinase